MREVEECSHLSSIQWRSILNTAMHFIFKARILWTHERLVAYRNKLNTMTFVIQKIMKR